MDRRAGGTDVRGNRGTTLGSALLHEVNVPVGGVEKVFPGCVAIIRQFDRHGGVPPRLQGMPNQPDVGFGGRSSTFSDVTLAARANDIIPTGGAAPGSRNDMIQAQVRSAKPMTAILARVVVAGKDASPIELDLTLRNSGEAQHANDSWDRQVVAYRPNPIVPVGPQLTFDDAEFRPIVKGVRNVLIPLPTHNFHERASGMIALEQESERPPHAYDA